MADLLELGRRGRAEELSRQAQAGRSSGSWTALQALELALAWLLAGDPRQADLAWLEADQLDPSLVLVPDVWGLWPAPAPSAAHSPHHQAAMDLAERFRAWRHPDPQTLWRQLLPALQANWHLALEPAGSDPLLILGHATATSDAEQLMPPLEETLVGLVADAQIQAEPAASGRFWQLLATIRPHWDLARIRAADLALARGDLAASGRWLADPPAAALTNPWFHDVAARQAVARGAVDEALDAWADAIRSAQADAATAALAEIFEQRRREARRGPGVLQVRSLAQRDDAAAALALLERLLTDDPQWQPLRSLKAQLLPSAQPKPQPQASQPPTPAGDGDGNGDGFSRLLDRVTARLEAGGWCAPAAAASQPGGPTSGDQVERDPMEELEAFSRRLSSYEARFALA